jgi:hypothetical protein
VLESSRMTDLAARFAINAPDVVAEKFDGEYVILNLQNGRYYALSGPAAAVWDDVIAGHTPEFLIAAVEKRAPARMHGVRSLLASLVSEGLVAADPGKGPPAEQPLSTNSIAGSDGDLGFEVYDDMADLILADPIHDVDEKSGWPARHSDQA